ncbi:hypothetical protein FQN51_003192 [Onygenales sp. PD_10]|nr:hypothetical protein FQN51_003192 [Onygenales sp. PD_10]
MQAPLKKPLEASPTMGTLHPNPRFMTGHLPSPHMLYAEISQSRRASMDLKEAICAWVGAVLYANRSQFVESLEEHIDVLRRGACLVPRAVLLFNLGSLWASVGDYRRAKDAYELSIKEDRDFSLSWFCRGICQFLLREYGESQKTFRKCAGTFKFLCPVQCYDDFGLDFVLTKPDALFNATVAKQYYNTQGGLAIVDSPMPSLRRQKLNLFLGPQNDYFVSGQSFSNKCVEKLIESVTLLLHHPSVKFQEQSSTGKLRGYVAVGFHGLHKVGPRVLPKGVWTKWQTRMSEDDQTPLCRAPVVKIPSVPLLVPRRALPSTAVSDGNAEHEERLHIINSFPVPPTTVKTPDTPLTNAGASVGERNNDEGQAAREGVVTEPATPGLVQQAGSDNHNNRDVVLPSNSAPGPVPTLAHRTARQRGPRVPLPEFVFPQPPLPVQEQGQSQQHGQQQPVALEGTTSNATLTTQHEPATSASGAHYDANIQSSAPLDNNTSSSNGTHETPLPMGALSGGIAGRYNEDEDDDIIYLPTPTPPHEAHFWEQSFHFSSDPTQLSGPGPALLEPPFADTYDTSPPPYCHGHGHGHSHAQDDQTDSNASSLCQSLFERIFQSPLTVSVAGEMAQIRRGRSNIAYERLGEMNGWYWGANLDDVDDDADEGADGDGHENEEEEDVHADDGVSVPNAV